MGIPSVCQDLASHLADSNWTVLRTSWYRNRICRLVDMVRTVVRKRREYAVAHVDVYSGRAFIWAEIVCKLLLWMGKPYILSLHGGNLPTFAKRWPHRVRRLLTSAAAVTTPSTYLHVNMRQYRSKLNLVHNPVDLNAYKFRLRDRPEPNIIWVRSFHSIYNPMMAVRVLAQLSREFSTVKLTMLGPDKHDGMLEAVRELAVELSISDRVFVRGAVRRNEIFYWLNENDIFLNTANVDNTPISVIEAMASGLCIVSTNVGGIPYLIQDDHDGLLVPAGDAEKMAQAVCRILTSERIAKRLSCNARKTAKKFDWSVVLPQWESLLCSVVKDNENA